MNPAIQFHRPASLQQLDPVSPWDIVVIGGGATGLGTALDASSRGFRTLLLEQADFSKGTSSRSTKLVHGGVRYLAQGNIKLVYDALHERGILLRNAPHLVKAQPFIIPCFSRLGVIKYLAGLTLYDWLAGRFSFGKSGYLRKKEVVASLPHIDPKKLKGGVRYFDGQFDDARLAINLAQTCAEQGAVLINYMRVTGLLKEHGAVNGVTATDLETGKAYSIKAKAVVNATGVFVDEVLRMDRPGVQPLVRPSQGIHLVFDRSILDSEAALMIPETSDGRVLFAVPWHGHVLVGTTDTPLNEHSMEPQALGREVEFIMQTLQQYLSVRPQRKDVLSVFAGLRPLAAPKNNSSSTKEISRDHKLMVSASGLITITGGKWTTYRKMAEDAVNNAIAVAQLPAVKSRTRDLPIHGSQAGRTVSPVPQASTRDLPIHGSQAGPSKEDHLSVYGSDAAHIRALMNGDASWSRQLHQRLPYTAAEVLWAVRHEMARTVEDVLARRLRALFLDARAAVEMAPAIASILAAELHYGEEWKQEQVAAFTKLAAQYLLNEGAAGNDHQHTPVASSRPATRGN